MINSYDYEIEKNLKIKKIEVNQASFKFHATFMVYKLF